MKRVRLLLALLLATSVFACGEGSKTCKEAVNHMGFGIFPKGAEGAPEGGELAIIKVGARMAIQECTKEGLSREQADCILAYEPFAKEGSMLTAMKTLSECPAIAKKRPSWLALPTPEQLSQMIAQERFRPRQL